MRITSQYDVLDVSDLLAPGAVVERQIGVAVAFRITRTKWYNEFATANVNLLERKVLDLHYANTRQEFNAAWDNFKDWADDHYVWVNEE